MLSYPRGKLKSKTKGFSIKKIFKKPRSVWVDGRVLNGLSLFPSLTVITISNDDLEIMLDQFLNIFLNNVLSF